MGRTQINKSERKTMPVISAMTPRKSPRCVAKVTEGIGITQIPAHTGDREMTYCQWPQK